MSDLLQRMNRTAVVLVAVALIAGIPRFYRLGIPDDYVFDEVYYAKDGCLYAGFDFRECGLENDFEQTWVHPPLGKWLIAGGEKAFGHEPFGWRVAAAASGTASVVVVAALALLLFQSTAWAFVAGTLLATESLSFVQSRIAMLDVFLAFWVVLGFLFLVLDRRWLDRRSARHDAGPARHDARSAEPGILSSPGPGAVAAVEPAPSPPKATPLVVSPLWRPWRLAAGAALGAAGATKWSGAFGLAGAWLLCVAWERTRRRIVGVRRPLWEAFRQETLGLLLYLLLVPVAVYVATYVGFFAENGISAVEFWRRQQGMFDFHVHLDPVDATTGEPSHPYLSRPYTWLLMLRPVAYFFEGAGTEILGIGNPVVFWISLVTLPYLAIAWWRRPDWRAGLVLIGVLAQYLPWIVFSRPQFLFYMTPMAPFLVLGATYLLRDLAGIRLAGSTSRPLLPIAVGIVVLSVALFAFFWPVLTAQPLSRTAWQARMWVSCGDLLRPFGCGWI